MSQHHPATRQSLPLGRSLLPVSAQKQLRPVGAKQVNHLYSLYLFKIAETGKPFALPVLDTSANSKGNQRLVTMPLNIISSIAQPATAGTGIAEGSSEANSAEFSSLLATLMSLTSATKGTGETGDTSETGETNETVTNQLASTDQTMQTKVANLSAALAGLDLQTEQSVGVDNGEPHAQQLLENLTKALAGLLKTFEETGTVNADQIETAHTTLEALTGLLSHAQQPLAPTAATNSQPEITAQPRTADAPAPTITERPEAGGKLPEALENLINRLIAKGPDGARKLEALADRLSELRPNLSARISELAHKLVEIVPEIAQKPAVATTVAPVAKPEIAGAAETIVAAVAKDTKTQAPQPQANVATLDDGTEVKIDAVKTGDIDAVEPKTEKPASGINTSANTTNIANDTKSDARPQPVTTNAANAQTAAATAPAAANTEAKPVDALMLAQTGQITAKTDFAAARPITAAYQSPAQQLNMPHVAFEMVRHIRDGAARFQIRLNPPEMGKIDVKMEIDNSGAINARLTVERPETLDLLQRDSRALERALAQAGLDESRTNLEFSLRQNPFARSDGQPGADQGNAGDGLLADAADEAGDSGSSLDNTFIYQGTASPGGVNMLA